MKHIKRTTHVTKGADPTEVVCFVVRGIDERGKETGDELHLEQFQNVVSAALRRADGSLGPEISESIARVIYDGLEKDFDREEELTERRECDELGER